MKEEAEPGFAKPCSLISLLREFELYLEDSGEPTEGVKQRGDMDRTCLFDKGLCGDWTGAGKT